MAADDDEPWFARRFELEALHFAAGRGDLGRVKELLADGNPINAFDDLGWTALHHAARKSHLAVVCYLIAAGADVNARDEERFGNTVLKDVAQTCSLELARILLDAGADPTIPGSMGLTALDMSRNRKRFEGPKCTGCCSKPPNDTTRTGRGSMSSRKEKTKQRAAQAEQGDLAARRPPRDWLPHQDSNTALPGSRRRNKRFTMTGKRCRSPICLENPQVLPRLLEGDGSLPGSLEKLTNGWRLRSGSGKTGWPQRRRSPGQFSTSTMSNSARSWPRMGAAAEAAVSSGAANVLLRAQPSTPPSRKLLRSWSAEPRSSSLEGRPG